MAESPSHKFGQLIGNLLEEVIEPLLAGEFTDGPLNQLSPFHSQSSKRAAFVVRSDTDARAVVCPMIERRTPLVSDRGSDASNPRFDKLSASNPQSKIHNPRYKPPSVRETFIGGHDFGDHRPTGRDVVVCAYPKAGQNWTMQIAVQIATHGTGEFCHIHEVVPWPDWAKQDMVMPLRDERTWRGAPTGLPG